MSKEVLYRLIERIERIENSLNGMDSFMRQMKLRREKNMLNKNFWQ